MARPNPKDYGLEFNAQIYREVAEEHITALSSLYAKGLYGLSIYVAGLSVESIFRAYRFRIDPQFDSRHDLYELERAARFADHVPAGMVRQYPEALTTVAMGWSNNHRFRSESALKAYLRRFKLNRGIKGDYLKENARRIISAASVIVTIGVKQWKS